MAHFAQLDENNIVLQVIVVANEVLQDENGIEHEHLGVQFCQNLLGGRWIQTSYNSRFRKNYAGQGFTYYEDLDSFIPPSPAPSWILNRTTCEWEAPISYPNDGNIYTWIEETQSWQQLEFAPAGEPQ